MKIKRIFIAVAATLPVFALSSITIAHGQDNGTSTDQSTSQTNEQEFEQRISEFKDKFKIRLSELEKGDIELKCVPAQKIVESLSTRVNAHVPQRTKAYEALDSHLTTLIQKLKAANVNTTTLEAGQTELEAKIQTYKTDLASYKQDLSDLANIDCKSDTSGFQAALEASRAAHQKVIDDIAAITDYVKNNLKPALVEVRKTLASQDSSSNGGTQ